MSEVLIFGGTTEGRLLAEFCAAKGIRAAVSVTTDYGAELLPRSYFIRELVGNLDSSQMSFLLKTDDFSIVIDATHPFAQKVSANLKTACDKAGLRYIRLVRDEETVPQGNFSTTFQKLLNT